MKVKYTIAAEGSAEETAIREALTSINLNVILVEKKVVVSDLLRDENFARDENFKITWAVARDSKIIPEVILNELSTVYDDTSEMTVEMLLKMICGAAFDANVSDAELESVLKKLIHFVETI